MDEVHILQLTISYFQPRRTAQRTLKEWTGLAAERILNLWSSNGQLDSPGGQLLLPAQRTTHIFPVPSWRHPEPRWNIWHHQRPCSAQQHLWNHLPVWHFWWRGWFTFTVKQSCRWDFCPSTHRRGRNSVGSIPGGWFKRLFRVLSHSTRLKWRRRGIWRFATKASKPPIAELIFRGASVRAWGCDFGATRLFWGD